jgi:hypothetical protein
LYVDKVFVAKRLAAKLRVAEHSIDDALVDATNVVAEILRARKELGLAANVGDVAVAKVTAAIAALSEARTAMVAGHADLAEVQQRIGIRTRMGGPEEKLEAVDASVELREVA